MHRERRLKYIEAIGKHGFAVKIKVPHRSHKLNCITLLLTENGLASPESNEMISCLHMEVTFGVIISKHMYGIKPFQGPPIFCRTEWNFNEPLKHGTGQFFNATSLLILQLV